MERGGKTRGRQRQTSPVRKILSAAEIENFRSARLDDGFCYAKKAPSRAEEVGDFIRRSTLVELSDNVIKHVFFFFFRKWCFESADSLHGAWASAQAALTPTLARTLTALNLSLSRMHTALGTFLRGVWRPNSAAPCFSQTSQSFTNGHSDRRPPRYSTRESFFWCGPTKKCGFFLVDQGV